MPNFEYLIVKNTVFSGWEIGYPDRTENVKANISEVLNQLGAEGWELTGVTSDQMGSPQKLFLKRSH